MGSMMGGAVQLGVRRRVAVAWLFSIATIVGAATEGEAQQVAKIATPAPVQKSAPGATVKAPGAAPAPTLAGLVAPGQNVHFLRRNR